jgi:CheY-like chemotaxis protein
VITNTRPNGPCILLVEDELEVRAYLEMTVRFLGYRVEVAESGNEVLRCLQSAGSDISLVLLDIIMPERDGLETLCEIRRMSATLPVIILAGEYLPMNVVAAMKCGPRIFSANRWCTKTSSKQSPKHWKLTVPTTAAGPSVRPED